MKKTTAFKRFTAHVFALALLLLLIPAYGQAKTVTLAVLPWKVNSAENMDFVKNAMIDMLTSRLGAGESVEVVRPDVVKAAIGEREVSDKTASEVGKKLKADYVLYGSLTVLGGAASLDAKLLNVTDGSSSPLFSKAGNLDGIIGMTDKLSADVLAIAIGAPKAAAAPSAVPSEAIKVETKETLPPPQQEGAKKADEGLIIKPKETARPLITKSKALDGLYIAFTTADLKKDGVKELFLLRKKALTIARMKDDGLEVIKEIKAKDNIDFVAITSIDSDNDGAAEVYISALRNSKPYGTLIEFKDNDYRETVTGIPWLMRSIQVGKKEPVLIGQAFRKPDGFYGDIRVLKKQGAEIVDKGPFEIVLPRKVDIYRFDAFDLANDGQTELVTLDDRGYVKIYNKAGDKWEKGWVSPEFYGGTLDLIEFREDRPDAAEQEPVPVEGRFFHLDLNKDGKAELVIKKNQPGGLGRWASRPESYTGGEILSLSWEGGLLNENWRTKQVNGYIADFFIEDLATGEKAITMLVVEGTNLLTGSPKSYVLSYRISI